MGGLGELLKDKGIVGEAGKHVGLLTQGSPYGKLAGMAFDKLAEKLPEVIEKIQNRPQLGGPSNCEHCHAFDRPLPLPQLPLQAAQSYAASLDTDKNGSVSREELTEGLADTKDKLDALREKAKDTKLTPEEASDLRHLTRMHQFGRMLERQYDAVAALDGNEGVSQSDLQQLAALDGQHDNIIGLRDWRTLYSATV